MVACSDRIKKYLDSLESMTLKEYGVAKEARKKGFDPEDNVDIPLAVDVAERCEGIVSAVAPEIIGCGIPKRIRELEKEFSSGDWRIAFKIAEEIAKNKFYDYKNDLRNALETGVRVGLAYVTLGVTCAPLEGFIELKLKKRRDGKDYCSIFFAGPIRAAGGTAAALTVLIADYARRALGISEYDPEPVEIERYFAEISDYDEKVSRLQYKPTKEEVQFIIGRVPVELNGDPTSKIEVSNFKRLERVETDLIRGGMCLVLGEGLCLKAKKLVKKISKWGADVGMQDWLFLNDYCELQKNIHAKSEKPSDNSENDKSKVKINARFIEELVAGRPVFSYPMSVGGFRLRYGRSRFSGLAAACISPATMRITDDFIATGTQLKVERPGKSCAISPCDSLLGPIVKMKNGDVIRIDSEEQAIKCRNDISEIIFLGDILFNYGDFYENGSMLVPPGFVPEWWVAELKNALENKGIDFKDLNASFDFNELIKNPIEVKVCLSDAVEVSKKLGIPLHPNYAFFYKNIGINDLKRLIDFINSAKSINPLILPFEIKLVLENLYIPHKVSGKELLLSEEDSEILLMNLGYNGKIAEPKSKDSLSAVNELSGLKIKDFGGTFIGARMGRPEKAKIRRMTGSPHGLFPVGEEGGRLRSFNAACEKGIVTSEFPLFFCESCEKDTVYRVCESCGKKTIKKFYCNSCKKISEKEKCCGSPSKSFSKRQININYYMRDVLKKTGLSIPSLVKGVKGVWDKDRITEPLMKAFLRAKNEVYVNKDGTVRYDMIETVCTHFICSEIGLSVKKAKELGYEKDIFGNELLNDNQMLELLPQDLILPDCREWHDASSIDFLFKTANFIDDELEYLYNQPRFFNYSSKDDLFGALVVSIAPHTSAGIISRIIGFSKSQGIYAHPYLHAACRRNADGDELCVILLMDALLNFSRQFLPDRRGSRTMDAPLVLSVKLDPLEIDSEAYNVDTVNAYPLDFYIAAENCKTPYEVKIKRVEDLLNTPAQYEGLLFTHLSSNINQGPMVSAYKTLATMEEKLDAQLGIAKKFRCVDENDVAKLIIDKHFLKDLKGNLRKYSSQGFRCVNCNEKYLRPPLIGKCVNCGGKIIFTIAEGSVKKYLEHCLRLDREYNLPDYLKQDLMILQRRIDGVFGKPDTKQVNLSSF
ncbi:MAG: DNA polymerase II large subunit [Candidatus Nanoarchaeia archaeon]|nr:DNA polymerase II large subunit [Candidatus Nanoarchaeia archaeon]